MFATHWVMGAEGANAVAALRERVFLQELGLSTEETFDMIDALSAHLLVHEEGQLVAAARMYPYEGGVRFDLICVDPTFRGQRFGDLCLRVMLDKAQKMGTSFISLRVPAQYQAYYSAFGFTKVGEEEGGMLLLRIEPDNIVWHSACGGTK